MALHTVFRGGDGARDELWRIAWRCRGVPIVGDLNGDGKPDLLLESLGT